jgi:hypothetical protein
MVSISESDWPLREFLLFATATVATFATVRVFAAFQV